MPLTVFRCLHIYGPPDAPGPTAGAFLAKGGRAVAVPGSGSPRIAPLHLGHLLARISPSLTPALMDLLLRDNVVSTPPAEIGERFGFAPTRLAGIWPARRG